MSDAPQQSNLVEVIQDYNATRKCVDKGTLCHAPESSMYFGRDGLVSACCYSRLAPLGRYPEQSIEEIWNGAQIKEMRAALRNNELPTGCELCADVLLARNYSGLLARGFDAVARPLPASGPIDRLKALIQPNKAKRWPVQLEFELSNTCNLECAMCSGFWSSTIRAKRENLPPLPQFYDSAFVEQLVPFLPHLKKAKFLGGEPFLIDVYYEIWEHLIELNPNCDVSITTNGTIYTSRVKRILEKLNCRITVSLDSITTPTYESIRRNAKLERTLSNLEAFCEINRVKKKGLSIAICPMSSNCREIPELVSFANERGIIVFFNVVVFPADQSIKALPRNVQSELLHLYRNANPTPRTDVEIANHAALEDYCHQIEFWMEKGKLRSELEERCAEWLVSQQGSGGMAALLSDLAGNNATAEGQLVQLGSGDPFEDLESYCNAVWEVGNRLQSEGVLSNVRYDAEEFVVFLDYLENKSKFDPTQARKIYTEMRRFPKHVLEFSGNRSASKLIEIIESWIPATVHCA